MKIAISIWDGRVSPVMDTASTLLIAEVVNGVEVSRKVITIPPANICGRASFISGLGIDLLICGAISHRFEQMLLADGVKLMPWFRGDIDDVIAAHLNGNLQYQNFCLPGSDRRGRYGRKCRRRGGPSGSVRQGKHWEDR